MAIDRTKAVKKLYSLAQIFNDSFDDETHTLVMQALGFDGRDLQRLNASNLRYEIEYDASNNPLYIGIAAPGKLTSDASWMIKKLTWDGSNNLTSLKFAGGTSEFTQIWDNRASLSYS